MKLTIKANNKMNIATIKKLERNGENVGTKTTQRSGEIYSVEIDFDTAYLWSDLEFWLEDENGNYCDHMCLNVSTRKKLQAHK